MESSGRTLVCSVLFLDIVEYSKKPVSEQLQLKQEFNRALTKALEQVPARDRIILDTGDGAAVTFMGDPEDALFAAMAVRDDASGLAVRLGVNLGPVRLVKDLNSQMNIIGDGINLARRLRQGARRSNRRPGWSCRPQACSRIRKGRTTRRAGSSRPGSIRNSSASRRNPRFPPAWDGWNSPWHPGARYCSTASAAA